eukprot:GEZU01029066.1.p1 GENE.GEZU01029066.1~~GEZU01029066.1.p1  ORF type:complete len:349 (+),score=172.27 GEZU01029066.1:88-1134(+)
MTNEYEGAIFAMCNPLLDISAHVDKSILTKYDAEKALGSAILAEEKHLPIFQELLGFKDVEFIAGGSAQNTMRVAQWMSQKPNSTIFVGAVGKDLYGEKLAEAVAKDGVKAAYYVDESTPTGTCACCIVDKERALITNLAAANNYKHSHLLTPELQNLLNQSKILYSSGFFLTVSPESSVYLGQHAAEHNKIYCTNISAIFIAEFFKDQFLKTLPYADFLFGNEEEAKALGKAMQLGTDDVAEIAKKISLYEKVHTKRPRHVVFTQGKDPVIVAVNGEVQTFPVPALDSSKIVDTNGAGDAFVGGFLSRLAAGKDIAECVAAGNYAAQVIIQRSGCTFPEKPDFQYKA